MDYFKNDKDNCVTINVFVECDKKEHHGEPTWEKQECRKCEGSCVEINVFAECDKKNMKPPCNYN